MIYTVLTPTVSAVRERLGKDSRRAPGNEMSSEARITVYKNNVGCTFISFYMNLLELLRDSSTYLDISNYF